MKLTNKLVAFDRKGYLTGQEEVLLSIKLFRAVLFKFQVSP